MRVANLYGCSLRALTLAFLALAASACASLAPRPVPALPAVRWPGPAEVRAVAIELTGDGGWSRIDRHLAAQLAAAGVELTSLNSLRYFWRRRTARELGAAVAALIASERTRHPRAPVVLLGYSMGADLVPFAFNRLPDAARAPVRLVVALNPAADAVLEFHLSQWWDEVVGPTYPTAPEFRRAARSVAVVSVCGRDDPDAACEGGPAGASGAPQSVSVAGDHGFRGHFRELDGALEAALARGLGPARGRP